MLKTLDVSQADLEAEFYSKPFYFSYSGARKLLEAPANFYKEYVMQQGDDKRMNHLVEGTAIHYLLLDGLSFDEKFIVSPEGIPSGGGADVVERVFELYKERVKTGADPDLELIDFPDEILDILMEINLHQSLKDDKKAPFNTGDDKRVMKVTESKYTNYFSYLVATQDGREIIDSGTLDRCSKRAELLKNHAQVRELLGMDRESDGNNYQVYNEMPWKMELPDGFSFGLKGILDNMTVDVENKLVRISDLKTTGKSVTQFPESVETWDYWLQAAIYLQLAMDFLKDVLDDTWKIEVRFIVIDRFNQIYPWQVSNGTLATWVAKMWEKLKKLEFHYTNKDYSLPYEFITGEKIL